MEINYVWKINNLERRATDEGIVNVHWQCVGTFGEISKRRYGNISFTPNLSSPSFIPFDQLTENDVLSWVYNSSSNFKDVVENWIREEIDELLNPKIITGLPWNNV